MTILIFANGDMDAVVWARPALNDATAVIAVDGGSRHLHRLDHLPTLLIGDMDSLPEDVRHWLSLGRVPHITHPTAKNETDLELALLLAAEQYPDELIVVFGAFGGRFDQTLANVLLLVHPNLHGRDIQLVTRYERAWIITAESEIAGKVGDTVSLIPLGGDVVVAQTAGLRWNLINDVLRFGPARGVSNELSAETATVKVQSGTLLCIHTVQTWGR